MLWAIFEPLNFVRNGVRLLRRSLQKGFVYTVRDTNLFIALLAILVLILSVHTKVLPIWHQETASVTISESRFW